MLRRGDVGRGDVSTHAPLAGSDIDPMAQIEASIEFQPTLPLRGATVDGVDAMRIIIEFQPTLPLRGATGASYLHPREGAVSTHAPLAGSDMGQQRHVLRHRCFNPRSPCGERQLENNVVALLIDVSTHAPLAGSDLGRLVRPSGSVVSTHAPLAGSDPVAHCLVVGARVSTHAPLAGSDHRRFIRREDARRVSTHAPLAGSDSRRTRPRRSPPCFNPRSPCGERPGCMGVGRDVLVSTHAPLAGSDMRSGFFIVERISVSTHAPLAGSDPFAALLWRVTPRFNPRSPCGERQPSFAVSPGDGMFQPTLPLRGATRARHPR